MAVTETPPETVSAASETAPSARRPQPTGLAAVLGSGDHKVIGRLYVASGLLFGFGVLVLGALFGLEGLKLTAKPNVFTEDTVFQFFTLFRLGTLFLLAFPLVIGLAFIVTPLQVGARTVAFPRAAAASFWIWLMGAALLVASYAMNGGPGGGRASGVDLWITAMGLLTIGVVVAAVSLATTVFALRVPGLTIARTPYYAWSVAVAAVLWLVTLPVLGAVLVVAYVDHRHGSPAGIGTNGPQLYTARVAWLLRNPQVYVVAIPVLGFIADVLATTAKVRNQLRPVVLGGIAGFGVTSFGAFLASSSSAVTEAKFTTALALAALIPILLVLAGSADQFRKGSFKLTAGLVYAVAALLALLLGVAAGALGSIPAIKVSGTIYELGVSYAVVLAAVIATLGGLHWWATKALGGLAKEGPGLGAAVLLLLGTALIAISDMASGIAGKDGSAELHPDWTGGIKGFNVLALIGVGVLALGFLAALVALVGALGKKDGDVPADPWEGISLEWLAPSPPPLGNFDSELPAVASAEPLLDLREEA